MIKKMARKSEFDYNKYMEFNCIITYLNGSIGSKSNVIGNDTTLEEKLKNKPLSSYLRGVVIFFEVYIVDSEVINKFPSLKGITLPNEIIDFYNENRTDQVKVGELKQCVEEYIIWLSNKFPRKNGTFGLGDTTAQNYQAQLRGFLSHNHVMLKFKNYDSVSQTKKVHDRYSVGYDELKAIGDKCIEYAGDFEFKTILKWLRISGLGSKELFILKMIDLRNKNWKKDYVRIDKTRQKTGVKFTTFLYGEVKEDVMKLIEINKNKNDEDFLFGEIDQSRTRVYNNIERKFKRVYKKVIEELFPQYLKAERSIFTLHKYRHLFQTICSSLRVPKFLENRFVAHKQEKLENSYILDKDFLVEFKKIQEEINGIQESSTYEEYRERMLKEMLESMTNKGRRQSVYKKNRDKTPEEIKQLNSQIKMDIFMQTLINTLKSEDII
jgi:integrase